ncbi:heparan-alpha-glucosaminide N-acetyltransferase [Methylobacterium iners]|nr:heparan-alpha-glucosaminide N-acetyltransferase [Methylobacterium iners]
MPASASAPPPRIDALDAARAACLLAMAAYHLVWDLGYLRLIPEPVAMSPAGKVAAHAIAGSFLVLVGIGLVLAHGEGIRWRSVLRRLARIAGAALLITAATWFAFPQSYIFFGILHCIALSSLLALPFLFVPAPLAALAAILAIAAPHLVAHPLLDAPALLFLGLGSRVPQTNDYVPLLPWFGLVLAGVATARLARTSIATAPLARWRARSRPARLAVGAGRHSLAIYLIHQPLLLGLLTGLAAVTGPHPRAGLAAFHAEYRGHCTRTGGGEAACRVAARCVSQALRREGLWATGARGFTPAERARAQALSESCYAAAEGTAAPP